MKNDHALLYKRLIYLQEWHSFNISYIIYVDI